MMIINESIARHKIQGSLNYHEICFEFRKEEHRDALYAECQAMRMYCRKELWNNVVDFPYRLYLLTTASKSIELGKILGILEERWMDVR